MIVEFFLHFFESCDPIDHYIEHVPEYSTFRWKTTLRINPKHIPDLHWQLENSLHTTNIGQTTVQICTPSVDVNTLSFTGKRKNHSKGINLHVDTSVIYSNTSAVISIDVNPISK